MKTKTNFATTSDVRNLINATMETFPKGPERDGIQTKMFNYWDNFNAGNNLPEGSDRKRFVAEALDNANAALRIARTLVNKGQQFSGAYVKVTDLISKLSKIKVGKNEMAKVEDNFYGKRVVKGIFAKARFAMEPNLQGMKKVRDEIYALAQTHLRLSEKSTDSQKQNYEYRIATGLSSFVSRAPYGAEIGMEFKGSAYWNKKAMQLATEGAAYGVIADKLIAEALSIYNSHSKPKKDKAYLAKAKFSHLSTMLDMLDYQSANDQEDLAKKNIKGLAQSIGKLNPTKDEWSRYVKIAKSLGFSESQISGFARTGVKAKFAKEYVMWGLPKGSTDRLDEKVMAEGLYTPAQVDDVKRRASADGWHSFRVVAMMSFDDMTNAFKGKGIKNRSSRTGAKAKFAFNLTKKVTYLNSDNYPQTYKVTDSLFAKLNLRDGNDRKYLEAALKTGEAVKISRKEAIS